MAQITWNQQEDKFFEAGLDRGVLYPIVTPGVPWNGLISVQEINTDTVDPVYFDGVKINDLVTLGDFSGTIKAYTYPEEFELIEGIFQNEDGLQYTGQKPKRFHLSYRTHIGDVDGNLNHYKIHLLYNLTAKPSTRNRQTLGMDVDPSEFTWSITSVPQSASGIRPTAHVILDTRQVNPFVIADVEEILYGTDTDDPRMPTMESLTAFMSKWERLVIDVPEDGIWRATERYPGYINIISADEFEITSDTAIFLDADTYEISSTNKNEDDLWQQ